MAIESRNTLKGWFETGDTPTQAQFVDFFDSYFHLTEDTLPANKVDGLVLTSSTITGSGSIELDEGDFLNSITIKATAAGQITVGYTAGAGDVANLQTFANNEVVTFAVNRYFNADGAVYVSGDCELILR